jgi:hypothetical protein
MWEDEVRIPPPSYRSAPQRRAAEARRMVVAVVGAGTVLLLCAVGYFATTGGGPAGVPVIQPPPGAVKVRPDDPGGLQVNTQTNALLGTGGSDASANLAPAPEEPDPAALAAAADQEQASPPAAAAVAHDGPPPTAPAIAVPTVPETPAPPQTALNVPLPSDGASPDNSLAHTDNPPIQSSGDGPVRVQLAALDSQEAAMREWEHLTHHMPALFDGKRPIFVEAHVNGHIFWRVRTAGFVSVTEATRFCADVHAQGAACTVALF